MQSVIFHHVTENKTSRCFFPIPVCVGPVQRKELIGMASNEQINALREIALNLYVGHPSISGYYVSKLKVYKNILQSLSDRAVENIAIKKLLRKHTEIIPLILKPHFKDGGGVSSGEEDDVRSADESVSE